MDSREQKLRSRINALEAELHRLSDALKVWLELDADSPNTTDGRVDRGERDPEAPDRFAGKKFISAVYSILSDGRPQTTAQIHDALVEGGFESDAKNFRSVVSNMLNEAAKHKRLIKVGHRKDARWTAPPVMLRFGKGEG